MYIFFSIFFLLNNVLYSLVQSHHIFPLRADHITCIRRVQGVHIVCSTYSTLYIFLYKAVSLFQKKKKKEQAILNRHNKKVY